MRLLKKLSVLFVTLLLGLTVAGNDTIDFECNITYDIIVKGFPADAEAHKIATYAYNTGGLDDMLLLSAENGEFTTERKHNLAYERCVSHYDEVRQERVLAEMDNLGDGQYYCHGHREEFNDWGLCGMSDYYHPSITNDERFLTDWQRQVDQCIKKRREGTRFYGWDNRYKSLDRFIIKQVVSCSSNT